MHFIYSLLNMLNEMSPYILLGFLIAGLLHAFISRQTFSRHLSGSGIGSVVKAALIGVPLPLCSCGVLPTAIAMRRNGASKAASSAFLISTPQTGVDSIAATWSLLGPAFAILRPITALVTAVAGGVAVGTTESPTEESGAGDTSTCGDGCGCSSDDEIPSSFGGRVKAALKYGFIDLVGSIGGWLVAGLIIAALITVYVPADFFSALGTRPILSMLMVLVVAIPMYVCATGSIPIALSLVMKGLSPGTAFVLLMAGPAANFASFTLISREMGRKSATVYLISIIIGAVATGLIIDYLLPASWFAVGGAITDHSCCAPEFELLPTICSAVLVSLLIYTYVKNHFFNNHIDVTKMTKQYQISGMNCPHCQAAVTKAIAAVEGVTAVDVNLSSGVAVVEGDHTPDAVLDAVHAAGFSAKIS